MALASRCVRGLVRFAAGIGLLLSLVHCSSPVPPAGTGDDSLLSGTMLGDNPFRDGGPTREEIVAAYFAQRGLSFSAVAESSWIALDGEAALLLRVHNAGQRSVTLELERSMGVWPFDSEEFGCVRAEVVSTWASARLGVQQSLETLRIDQFGQLEVAPGSSGELCVPLGLALPKGAEALVARLAPVLYPLAIRFGDEPERVITIRFPELELRFGPAAVALAAAGDAKPFERALEEIPAHVIAASLRRSESARQETIDQLIVSLPGPDARGRRARCVALEWLTERRFGDSVERWRSWWEAEGAATAATGDSR